MTASSRLADQGQPMILKLSFSSTFFKFVDSGICNKTTKILMGGNLSDKPLPIIFEKP